MQKCIESILCFSLTVGNPSGSLCGGKGIQPQLLRVDQAVFLPEASDFIARNSAETVQITKDAGSIDHNAFVKGLQEQAIESKVSVSAGVHLPTNSESHVRPRCTQYLTVVCQHRAMDKSLWKNRTYVPENTYI
jgi:hypothetical protein